MIQGPMIIREMKIRYKTHKYKIHKVDSPSAVIEISHKLLKHQTQEIFIVFCLDSQNQVVGYHICTIGTVNESIVHPREVFKAAILSNATAIILVHNHPSGSLNPSREDEHTCERLKEAGKIVGICVLDFLIIGGKGYCSFKEMGIL